MKRYTKNLLNNLYNIKDTLSELLNYLEDNQEEDFLNAIRYSIRNHLELLLELEPENEFFNDLQTDINIIESTYKNKELILYFDDDEIKEMILEAYNEIDSNISYLLK